MDRLRKLVRQENELNERGSYVEKDGRRWYSISENSGLKNSLDRDLSKYGMNYHFLIELNNKN